jgi:hypothetical protein
MNDENETKKEKKEIRHIGVLGMRWGRRKRSNPHDEELKIVSKKFDKSIDKAIKDDRFFSKVSKEQKKKNWAEMEKDSDAFEAQSKKVRDFERTAKKLESHQVNQEFGWFSRAGKKKGQSDEDFDREKELKLFGEISQSPTMKKRVAEIRNNKMITSTAIAVLGLAVMAATIK